MFLKSRSQLNTSGKLLRSELGSMVRMASLFWRKNAKFLLRTGNGLLLPSSLHSKLCLRSTGSGAPRTRTTGASFRSKDWAFGPFPCFSSCFPFCSFLAYFLLFRQTRHGSLVPRSPLLSRQTCLFLQIGNGITSFIIVARAAHSVALAWKMTLAQVSWTWVWCVVFTYPPVKDDFKIPIFIIVFNIWPFGVIFGCYGTLSDDSDSAQVRFLRHPQREGQRGRCSAKHTKS